MSRRIVFTEEGRLILERIVLDAFIRDPDETQKISKVFGISLTPMIRRHLKRYLEIEGDLLKIKMGMKPIYNPIEYYTGKK